MPKKILVVDDNLIIVDYLSNVLMREGYLVDTAQDGIQGLDKLRRSPPDLLILDLMMPRMNGISMFKQMKKEDALKDVPVIMLTAIEDVIEEEGGWGAGERKGSYSKRLETNLSTLKAEVEADSDIFHLERLENILSALKAAGQAGPEIFLEKPVDLERVMDAVKNLIGAP